MRMASLNQVTLIGRLGRDPEIRHTNAGDPVASLSLATSESWRDKATGERQERTEWHRIVAWGEGLCGVIQTYCEKGGLVMVQGRLETRKWTDNQGHERYTTEVVLRGFQGKLVLLGSRAGGAGQGSADDEGGEGGKAATVRSVSAPEPAATAGDDDLDDEIPF
jgi:single-strand DNA-binding protein